MNGYCLLFRQKNTFFIHSKLSQISISFKILSKNILMGFSMIVNQKKIWWSVYLWKNCFQEADPDHQWRLLMTSMVFIKLFMINGTLNAPYPVRSLKLGENTYLVNNWSCIFTFGWSWKSKIERYFAFGQLPKQNVESFLNPY